MIGIRWNLPFKVSWHWKKSSVRLQKPTKWGQTSVQVQVGFVVETSFNPISEYKIQKKNNQEQIWNTCGKHVQHVGSSTHDMLQLHLLSELLRSHSIFQPCGSPVRITMMGWISGPSDLTSTTFEPKNFMEVGFEPKNERLWWRYYYYYVDLQRINLGDNSSIHQSIDLISSTVVHQFYPILIVKLVHMEDWKVSICKTPKNDPTLKWPGIKLPTVSSFFGGEFDAQNSPPSAWSSEKSTETIRMLVLAVQLCYSWAPGPLVRARKSSLKEPEKLLHAEMCVLPVTELIKWKKTTLRVDIQILTF